MYEVFFWTSLLSLVIYHFFILSTQDLNWDKVDKKFYYVFLFNAAKIILSDLVVTIYMLMQTEYFYFIQPFEKNSNRSCQWTLFFPELADKIQFWLLAECKLRRFNFWTTFPRAIYFFHYDFHRLKLTKLFLCAFIKAYILLNLVQNIVILMFNYYSHQFFSYISYKLIIKMKK